MIINIQIVNRQNVDIIAIIFIHFLTVVLLVDIIGYEKKMFVKTDKFPSLQNFILLVDLGAVSLSFPDFARTPTHGSFSHCRTTKHQALSNLCIQLDECRREEPKDRLGNNRSTHFPDHSSHQATDVQQRQS